MFTKSSVQTIRQAIKRYHQSSVQAIKQAITSSHKIKRSSEIPGVRYLINQAYTQSIVRTGKRSKQSRSHAVKTSSSQASKLSSNQALKFPKSRPITRSLNQSTDRTTNQKAKSSSRCSFIRSVRQESDGGLGLLRRAQQRRHHRLHRLLRRAQLSAAKP